MKLSNKDNGMIKFNELYEKDMNTVSKWTEMYKISQQINSIYY